MKQRIRINENQLRQIVMESVKRVLNEGIGDEYLDNFGKSVSRSKRFGNVKDLSSWSDEQFDSLNSTRKDMHNKGRGVKTKGSTETRDWLRKQTEKGNPIIKYKKNPDEWMKKHLDSVDESKIKKAIKESVKRVLKEEFEKPSNWKDTQFKGTFEDENGALYMPDEYESHDEYDGYYYSISSCNKELEALECFEEDGGYSSPDEAYNEGLNQLKSYYDGMYMLEVYHFVTQSDGNHVGDYDSGYLAVNNHGRIKEY